VLVGDFLFSPRLRADGRGRQPQGAQDPQLGASRVIAEGEVDQLTAQRQIETSEERYLHIIGAKTAALFAAACRIAAVVAECGEERRRRSTPTAATSASPSSWSTTRSTTTSDRRRWARTAATTSATAR
jgi:geranylgeranyl pyrophosphate synthase